MTREEFGWECGIGWIGDCRDAAIAVVMAKRYVILGSAC
jgi:hypothetical protein